MLLQAYEYSVAYPNLTGLNEFMQFNEKDIDLPLFSGDIKEIKSRQFENKRNKNEFIDASVMAGHLKHELYNPTNTDIPDYDTTAAHLFRTALMAICLKNDFRLIKNIVSMHRPESTMEKQMIFELETIENILQAYEYTKLYPNEENLNIYLQKNKDKISLLKKFVPTYLFFSSSSKKS